MSQGRLGVLATLVWKDIRVEAREAGDILVEASFTVIAAVAAASLGSGSVEVLVASASLYAVFLTALAGFSLLSRDVATGSLEGLRLAPVEGWAVLVARVLVNMFIMYPQLAAFMVVYTVFSGSAGALAGVLPLLVGWAGSLSLFQAALAAFVAVLLIYGEARVAPVAVLVAALSLPYLVGALNLLSEALAGHSVLGPLLQCWATAAAFAAIASLTADALLEG